jgi:hypothetical protein
MRPFHEATSSRTQSKLEKPQSAEPPPIFPLILILGSLVAFGPLSIDMYLPAFPKIAETLATNESTVELSLAGKFRVEGIVLDLSVFQCHRLRYRQSPIT